jgi:hypothetical protein
MKYFYPRNNRFLSPNESHSVLFIQRGRHPVCVLSPNTSQIHAILGWRICFFKINPQGSTISLSRRRSVTASFTQSFSVARPQSLPNRRIAQSFGFQPNNHCPESCLSHICTYSTSNAHCAGLNHFYIAYLRLSFFLTFDQSFLDK